MSKKSEKVIHPSKQSPPASWAQIEPMHLYKLINSGQTIEKISKKYKVKISNVIHKLTNENI